MTDYDMPLERALKELNPQQMQKYIMTARLDNMVLSYEERLGADTKRIIAKRELDPTDSGEQALGAEWYKK